MLFGGTDPHTRCYLPPERTSNGYLLLGSLPARQCYDWTPVRRFRGIYIDEFEGQRFIEHGAPKFPLHPGDHVWVEKDQKTDAAFDPRLNDHSDLTRVWDVEFVGRKTARPGRYGHGDVSPEAVLVDRFISARLIHERNGYLPDVMLAR